MIISVDVVKVHYEHAITYISHIPDITKAVTKLGATVLGWYRVEAGGQGEIVFITKWAGVEARSKGFAEAMKDPAIAKLHEEMVKCIDTIYNYLRYPNPAVNIDHWQANKPIGLRMYNVKGPQALAAKKYLDILHQMKAKTGATTHLAALLHPIAFPVPIGLIALFEPGEDGIDEGLHKIFHAAADPANTALMLEIHETFTAQSNRILQPLTPEVIAMMASHHTKK